MTNTALQTTVTDPAAQILATLRTGAATVGVVVERTQIPTYIAFGTLRALSIDGKVKCGRKRTPRGTPVGPLYWYLADNPLPPLRARPKPKPAAVLAMLAMVEAAQGGHDDHTPISGMDLLARLACRGGYPNMTGAVGTGPTITPEDISGMLHDVEDKLGVAMAVAIGCATTLPWPEVHDLGFPRVLEAVQQRRDLRALVSGDHRSRVRYVLHDAFHDLARWRRTIPWHDAARAARMRRVDYCALYVHTAYILRSVADDAARSLLEMHRDEETADCC